MILYYSPQTRAFPVLWTLEELAVEYELKIVNLKQAEQKKDEYRRLNPMMKVPVLTDGDVVVTETGAILQYLAEKNSPPCLLPQLGDATRHRWRAKFEIERQRPRPQTLRPHGILSRIAFFVEC